MSTPEVVYDPALDAPWYVVQAERSILNYGGQEIRTEWEIIAVYPGTEREKAEQRARDVYANRLGEIRVRVIRTGKGETGSWPPYDH